MSMKKADLEKFNAKRVEGAMRREALPDRYGAASGHVHDKREQRKRDQAAGLVPFAVKLPQDLVAALQARARERSTGLNDVVAELLKVALGVYAGAASAPAPVPAPATPAATEPAPRSNRASTAAQAPAAEARSTRTAK
jgi:hypothetical protein